MGARGALIERTSNAPVTPLARGITGYADIMVDGRKWRVAAEVAARGDKRLDPVPALGVPAEVRPLTDAVNALRRRLEDAFARKLRFTSDCAHMATLDLRYIARLVLADIAPAAAEKDIEITLQGSGAPVRGNVETLAILLRNLLENAIRYTPPGGKVAVGTRPGKDAVLTVEDNGPGIPAGEREHVFERFYRVPGAYVAGCGLGLSIVQRVAQMHHAKVTLGEAEPGRGLRVEIRFPTR
jgi:two-component system OmpR family sensor kinase